MKHNKVTTTLAAIVVLAVSMMFGIIGVVPTASAQGSGGAVVIKGEYCQIDRPYLITYNTHTVYTPSQNKNTNIYCHAQVAPNPTGHATVSTEPCIWFTPTGVQRGTAQVTYSASGQVNAQCHLNG